MNKIILFVILLLNCSAVFSQSTLNPKERYSSANIGVSINPFTVIFNEEGYGRPVGTTWDMAAASLDLSYIWNNIYFEFSHGATLTSPTGILRTVTIAGEQDRTNDEEYKTAINTMNVGYAIPIYENKIFIVPFLGRTNYHDRGYFPPIKTINKAGMNYGAFLMGNILHKRLNAFIGTSNNQVFKIGLGYVFNKDFNVN
jgi:hypothetical protein